MDKSDLKKILKPLVKEIIKEVLLESNGILSNIVQEVANGIRGSTLLSESKNLQQFEGKTSRQPAINKQSQEIKNQFLLEREDRAKKIMNKTGIANVFENLSPLPNESFSPSKQMASTQPTNFSAGAEKNGLALKGVAPGDSGVNINGILGLIGGSNVWKNQLKSMKKDKNETK